MAHRTAYHVLRSVAALEAGEELVVLGAGAGVGLAGVQLGAALGASVTAVASSTEKLEVARSQGANRVINHTAGHLRAALRQELPDGADVVVDPVGAHLPDDLLPNYAELMELLSTGRIVPFPGAASPSTRRQPPCVTWPTAGPSAR